MASWRDDLKIHPAANLFPLMSSDELRALGTDIKTHGLTSSIVFWSDGKSPALLLDGRNCLDAIEMVIGPAIISAASITAGKDFLAIDKVIVLDKSVDPFDYVISANIHRRHLDAKQKREVIASLIKALPEKPDRQIAAMLGVSHHTVASVRAEMEGRGQIAHVEIRTDSLGRQQPASKSKSPPVSEEMLKERADAAERIRELMGDKANDDSGPTSSSEDARETADIENLKAEKRRLDCENIALRRELRDARASRSLDPLDPLAWTQATLQEREHYLAVIGRSEVFAAIPRSWNLAYHMYTLANETFAAEFKRRLPLKLWRKHQSTLKPIIAALDHLELDLKADPGIDSEATKH